MMGLIAKFLGNKYQAYIEKQREEMRERREFNWKVPSHENEFSQELDMQRHNRQLNLSDLNSFLHQRDKFTLSVTDGKEVALHKKQKTQAVPRPSIIEFDKVFALEKFFSPHQISLLVEATEKIVHRHGHLLSDEDFTCLYSLDYTRSPQKIAEFAGLFEGGRLCNVLSQNSINSIDRVIQSSLEFYKLRKSFDTIESGSSVVIVSDLPLHRLLSLVSVLGLDRTFPHAKSFVSSSAFGREYTLLSCANILGQSNK